MNDRSNPFWGELRRRAASKGITELTVRFRKDSSKKYLAKLTLNNEDQELRLSPQAVAAWKEVDVKAIAASTVDEDPNWPQNFQTYNGVERLSPWQACVYLFGPLHSPKWGKHSYNPIREFLVDANEARKLCDGIDDDEDWISLADLAQLLGPNADAAGEPLVSSARSTEFPRLEDVASLFGSGSDVEKHALHNLGVWTTVHGSLALLDRYPHQFDPREDYWWLPERRLLVCYFDERFAGRYLPASAMRRVAHVVFAHFDEARRSGRLGERVLASDQAAIWDELLAQQATIAAELPSIPEYAELRKTWRHLKVPTVREDLIEFINAARSLDGPSAMDRIGFIRRMPWFPYLGLRDETQLASRQMFFAAYHRLFTNTNSYQTGGSMGFAPVLQNNPTDTLLGYVRRWTKGETPEQTRFDVQGRDEQADRRHYNVVVELYGFLNLHKQPFHNNKALAYESFAKAEDESVLPRLVRIGELVRDFVAKRDLASKLSAEFRRLVGQVELSGGFWLEGIRAGKKANENQSELAKQSDARFENELRAAAVERSAQLSDLDAATTMFHLLLDSYVYSGGVGIKHKVEPPRVEPSKAPAPPVVRTPERMLQLPRSLESVANDALAILKSGFHVLFAGAPGTGKTTAAQFVGHAWNSGLADVETQIPLSAAPLTTVGNSAWAPFHTIGGILPNKEGRFVSKAGIFIDPKSQESTTWRLRDECVVLDEMNRADLDRCIGELYPLLSLSVDRVSPAGIPGVETISATDRFRLVATVNDANLDDVVFPISEGLARRFIRIELDGARMPEIQDFLSMSDLKPEGPRVDAATRCLHEFFQLARDHGFVRSTDLGEHLPFGVGYFGLFRSWCCGGLSMSSEFSELDLPVQARRIIRMCLRAATKERKWEALFRAYEAEDDET